MYMNKNINEGEKHIYKQLDKVTYQYENMFYQSIIFLDARCQLFLMPAVPKIYNKVFL